MLPLDPLTLPTQAHRWGDSYSDGACTITTCIMWCSESSHCCLGLNKFPPTHRCLLISTQWLQQSSSTGEWRLDKQWSSASAALSRRWLLLFVIGSAPSVLNHNQQQQQQQAAAACVQGRAARGNFLPSGVWPWKCVESFNADDYYDTEDPSVNLQEFIVNSMQVNGVATNFKICVNLFFNSRLRRIESFWWS